MCLIDLCDIYNGFIGHDRLICVVTLLIDLCDMTHSCVTSSNGLVGHDYWFVWRDSCICGIWLIHVCDMTVLFVWYDWLMCVTCPMYLWGHDWLICVTWLIHTSYRLWDMTHSCVWHDCSICVIWLIDLCDMSHVFVGTWLIDLCDMTHSYVISFVGHDSFMSVTWLLYLCELIDLCDMCHVFVWSASRSCVWHASFRYGTWLIHLRGMTYSYVTWLIHSLPDSFICDTTRSYVTWLIHVWHDSFICDITHSYVICINHRWHDPFICDMIYLYVPRPRNQQQLSFL